MSGDLRVALRTLLKTPRFTAPAVLVLALAIGANSAMFSVVETVLLRALPYHDPNRLMAILAAAEKGTGRMPVTPGDFEDVRAQAGAFSDMAAASVWSPTLTGFDRASRVDGLRVSADPFRVLGVQPAAGRLFDRQDARPDAPSLVVISHALYEQRFGGDPAVVGRTIHLDGQPYTVAGVTARGFFFPPFWAARADIFALQNVKSPGDGGRGPGYLRVFGRLKAGVSTEQAKAEVTTIARRLAHEYPRSNAGLTFTVTPIHEMSAGDVRPVLLVLFGAVACTLLIGSANIANLVLARAWARRKEIAIRQSLGAARFHLVRQFVSETVLLAAAGCSLGLAAVWWALPLMVRAIPESAAFRLARHDDIRFSGLTVIFTVAVSIATALFCGILTALNAGGADPGAAALKESGRGQVATRAGRNIRTALASAEIAIALLLVAAAGLLVESYRKVQSVDPGFDADGVLAVTVGLAASEHADPDRRALFYSVAMTEFRGLPGVTNASAVNHVPLAGDRFGTDITIEGQPAPAPGETPNAVYRVAMPGYFDTMRIRVMQGRDFSESDNETAPRVVIVNQSAARRFWGGGNPIGRRICRGDAPPRDPWLTVIGVAADVKQSEWKAAAESEIYIPFAQDEDYRHNRASFLTMTLVLRAANERALIAAVRDRIASIDRNIAVSKVHVMRDVVRDATWQPRASMSVVGGFAVMALILAAVGVYAVVSFTVAGRTQEIGLRMALGARGRDVLVMVVRQSLPAVAGGVAAGTAASLVLTRLMKAMLYEVRPADPVVIAGAAAGLAAVALMAALIPARRAARYDPLAALREE